MAVLFNHRWPDDPRLIEVGAIGGWLLVRALCYSDTQETDGFVPGGIVRREAAAHSRKVDGMLDEMVRVGIFAHRDREGIAGFQIHADFLEGQFTKAQKAEHRRLKAEAGRVGGRKSGEVRRKRTGSKREATASGLVEANAKQTAKENEAPSPSPSPSPDPAVSSADLKKQQGAGMGVQVESQTAHAAPSAPPQRGSATSDADASSAARDGKAARSRLPAAAKDGPAASAAARIAAGDAGAAARTWADDARAVLRSKGLDV